MELYVLIESVGNPAGKIILGFWNTNRWKAIENKGIGRFKREILEHLYQQGRLT